MSEVQELRAGLAKLLYAKVWESSRVGNEWMVGELVFLVMNRCFSRGDFFQLTFFLGRCSHDTPSSMEFAFGFTKKLPRKDPRTKKKW